MPVTDPTIPDPHVLNVPSPEAARADRHLRLLGAGASLPAPRLSETASAFFRHQGYLRLPAKFTRWAVAALSKAIDDEFAQELEPVRRDSTGRVVRLSHIYERREIFRRLLGGPELLDPLSDLLGPNIELVLNRHNHATFNTFENKAQRLHRDVLQWSRPIVSAIVYVDAAPVEAGPTMLIPGSQFLPYVGTPNNGGTWMDEHHVYAEFLNQAVPVPMTEGDVLLFDGLLFHASGPNHTESPRRIITAAYRSVDELVATTESTEHVLVRGDRLYRGDS